MNAAPPDWYIFAQALGDGIGYPKSKESIKRLGFSKEQMQKLHDQIINDRGKEFTDPEKQMILNCLEGALDYVNWDIPILYDISKSQLLNFLLSLEVRWGLRAHYVNK